jgi:hypothetical protein
METSRLKADAFVKAPEPDLEPYHLHFVQPIFKGSLKNSHQLAKEMAATYEPSFNYAL